MAEPLTRERILEAALEHADEHGLAALSMRKVAARLDVEAMSLYRHIRNKADLLDGLYDHLVGQVVVADTGDDWRSRTAATAHTFRDVLATHPRLVPLVATRAASTQRSLAVLERGVAALEAAGFAADASVHAFQTVFCFVIGHCVFHMADGTPPDPFADAEFEAGLQAILRGLDPLA
jgi:AcrR family transcriptional regulator